MLQNHTYSVPSLSRRICGVGGYLSQIFVFSYNQIAAYLLLYIELEYLKNTGYLNSVFRLV